MNKNYISQIPRLLAKTGWSQERLAGEVGVTFAALSRWIHGHAAPRPNHAAKIGQLFREHVGLEPIAPKNYRKILKEASGYRIKGVSRLIRMNENLIEELRVEDSFNSNTIEGTTLSFRETETLIRNHVSAAGKPFFDNLVISNHAAILWDIFLGKYGELSEHEIKEMHGRLFQGIRRDAGEYSKHQRGIVGLNIQLPHPEDIPEEMNRFVREIRKKPPKQHPIEWIASCHADFELIHPFGDGNGRIGRLLLTLQCLAHDYPPIIIENARKAEYYETLEHAQRFSADHLTVFLIEELKRAHRIIRKYGG